MLGIEAFQKCILCRNMNMEEKLNSIILGGPYRKLFRVPGVLDPGVLDPGVLDPGVLDPGVLDLQLKLS